MLSICQTSTPCSKCVVGILPSLSGNAKVKFKFYTQKIPTPFILKCLRMPEKKNSKCLKPTHGKAIYLKSKDFSIKAYWYLKIWKDRRLGFSSLHGSCCSCDGCWHEVMTSVISDVLKNCFKLPYVTNKFSSHPSLQDQPGSNNLPWSWRSYIPAKHWN